MGMAYRYGNKGLLFSSNNPPFSSYKNSVEIQVMLEIKNSIVIKQRCRVSPLKARATHPSPSVRRVNELKDTGNKNFICMCDFMHEQTQSWG